MATSSMSGSASGIVTSMPLTTIFTPPPSCSERPFTYFTDDGTTSTFWRDMDLSDSACYPYSYAYQHDPTVSAIYSPGVCPEAYVAAQYSADGPTGEQVSWCCPLGMTYGTYACQSLVTTNTVAVYDASRNVSLTAPFVAADWYIAAAWASSDLNEFTPASAPVLSTTSTSIHSVSSVPTRIALGSAGPTGVVGTGSSVPVASQPEDTGLSTGAKAGIGVGVAAGAIAAIGLIAFFVIRRRRDAKWKAAPTTGRRDEKSDVVYAHVQQNPAEIHEAEAISRPAEVPGTPYRAELEGGWQGNEMTAK